MKITGNLIVEAGDARDYSLLAKCGYVEVKQGATFTAPALIFFAAIKAVAS